MKLTDKQASDVYHRLLGTADSIDEALDAIGVDSSDFETCDVESQLADMNLERCPECDWWCEAGELVDEDGEPCACEGCGPRTDGD